MVAKFLRRTWSRYSKLGKGRKKKQVWRRPTGRDNKMREKRRGYPAVVSIGHSTDKKLSAKIQGKMPIIVNNLKELGEIKKNQIAIMGKVGKKKKIEMAKTAKENKIEIQNLNVEKFLKQVEKDKEKEEVKTDSKTKEKKK